MGQCWDYIAGTVQLGKVWTNGRRALRQSAAILTEKWRADSVKSLASVSCDERGKKYLILHYASSAEPPRGIDEPHPPSRGKPILVSVVYFADATLATGFVARWPQGRGGRRDVPGRRETVLMTSRVRIGDG